MHPMTAGLGEPDSIQERALISITHPLNAAVERFRASAALGDALQVQAWTSSTAIAPLATKTTNISLASLIAFVFLFESR
jgi:hypothetical protein